MSAHDSSPARPVVLGERFAAAAAYAAEVHATQRRKGTSVPYVAHLLGVASIVLEHGGDEETAVAALLHDAVEDQGGPARLADIAERFGSRVAIIVRECSDSTGAPKPPWRTRKEDYHRRLRHAPPDVLLVSAADKLHNLRTLLLDYREHGESVWHRFNAGREDQMWNFRALLGTYAAVAGEPGAQSGFRSLVEEVRRAVAELEAMAAARPTADRTIQRS